MSAVINSQEIQAPTLNPNLHLQVNLLGVGFLIFALITSFLLYGSFGHTDTEIFTYRLMGILLCLSTAIMLKLCYTLWTNGNSYLSVCAFILYFCLFLIEWSTGVGFTSLSLTHVKENSGAAIVINEQSKLADIKLNSLAQYQGLSVEELTANKFELKTKVTALNAALKACPYRDYTHCQKPKQDEIKILQAELKLIKTDLINANKYAFAFTQKQQALKAVVNPDFSESNAHPLFKVQSKLFKLEINETESNYLGFSSLICTILTSILFLMAAVLKNRFVMIPVNINRELPETPSPALSSPDPQPQQPRPSVQGFFSHLIQELTGKKK